MHVSHQNETNSFLFPSHTLLENSLIKLVSGKAPSLWESHVSLIPKQIYSYVLQVLML